MATYQLGNTGQTWHLPKNQMGWDQLIRHIKNCSLPYFLPELAELALVTDMCFLLGRHRPLLLTHHPGYLACPSLFTTSPHSVSWLSQTHILSWNTRQENISCAWWREGGGVLVENGWERLLVENGWWLQLGFWSLNRQGTLGMGFTQLGYMYEQQKKYTFESQQTSVELLLGQAGQVQRGT